MLKFNYKGDYWYEYITLSNGQTAAIIFDRYDTAKVVYYYVMFAIGSKRKHVDAWLFSQAANDLDCNTTGKCGIEGLIWAYTKLQEFENVSRIDNNSKEVRIIIQGSDSRRFRIYEHFLKRLGYIKRLEQKYGWCLVKILNKQK